MTDSNRRDFLKSSALASGAAAVTSGASSLISEKGSVVEEAEQIPVYEIYALKYAGPFTSKLAMVYWNDGWNEDIDRNYYIWVIKGKGENIIVDTGTGVTLAKEKHLKGYVNPVDVLAQIGVTGSNVSKVILTHIHFDHIGGLEMFPRAFPKATYYVQQKEFDFWTKNPIAKRRPFVGITDAEANKTVAAMEGSNQLKIINGIKNHARHGTSACTRPYRQSPGGGSQIAKGTSIAASDCAHIARSFKDDNPSCLITDMVRWMESYDKLRAKASSLDVIFPGHDVMMLQNYPKVSEDITRLV